MSVVVHARSEHARGGAVARRLRERSRAYLAALAVGVGELSIVVVTDAAIRALNRAWRGKDRATDVLSFPAAPNHAGLLGDVVISLDTARRVARAEGRSPAAELDRYLAHGLLHLLGHDHERAADARRMAAAEDRLVGAGMVRAALAPARRPPFDSAALRSGRAESVSVRAERSPQGCSRSTGRGRNRSRA